MLSNPETNQIKIYEIMFLVCGLSVKLLMMMMMMIMTQPSASRNCGKPQKTLL
jgi:hypothetical protein